VKELHRELEKLFNHCATLGDMSKQETLYVR